MSVTPGQLIQQADMDALATLANSVLAPDTPFAFPPDEQWIDELNRLRFYIFIRSNLYDPEPAYPISSDWLLSGPWCVGVGHSLYSQLDAVGGLFVTCYKDVVYYYAEDDAPGGVTLNTGLLLGLDQLRTDVPSSASSGPSSFTLSADQASTLDVIVEWTCQWIGGGAPPSSAPDISAITHSSSLGGVSWVVTGDGSLFRVTATLSGAAFGSGAGQTFDFQVDPPTDYQLYPEFGGNSLINIRGFLTLASESSSSDALGIHPTSAVKSITAAVTASTTTLECNGVKFMQGYQSSPKTEGVFAAKTLPIQGIHTFLDIDLPNYSSSVLSSRVKSKARRGAPIPATTVATVTPTGNNRSALWPVWRDTEFGVWRDQTPVPYFSVLDGFHGFASVNGIRLAAGQTYTGLTFSFSSLRHGAERQVTANLPMYVSTGIPDPEDPDTYDFVTTGALILPDDVPPEFAAEYANAFVFFTILNDTASAVVFDLHTIRFVNGTAGYYPGDAPTFFAVNAAGAPWYEDYSYCLSPGTLSFSHLPIPMRGYCVFDVIVRRKPIVNGAGINVAATTGAELAVKIGVMRGFDIYTPGAFVELATITIPENESQSRERVFWPVVGGVVLAYQADQAVQVLAAGNFQPLLNVGFAPEIEDRTAFAPGTFSGKPFFSVDVFKFFNNSAQIIFPISSDVYNDFEALLNVL